MVAFGWLATACGAVAFVGYALQGDAINAGIELAGALTGGIATKVIKVAWRAVAPKWRASVQRMNSSSTTRSSLAKGDRAVIRAGEVSGSVVGATTTDALRAAYRYGSGGAKYRAI